MRVVALVSGGKDSIYAMYWALNQGWEIPCMISVEPKSDESWMFHYPNVWLTKLQAEAMGIRQVYIKTLGEKEKELDDLEKALANAKKEYNVIGVLSGAVASEYQRTRLERVAYNAGLKNFNPLWHKDQARLVKDVIRAGFDVVIAGVSAEGLGKELIGKKLDEFLNNIGKSISPVGEGGEFETLVLDGPIFHKKIVIDDYEIIWDKGRGYLKVDKARLIEK